MTANRVATLSPRLGHALPAGDYPARVLAALEAFADDDPGLASQADTIEVQPDIVLVSLSNGTDFPLQL